MISNNFLRIYPSIDEGWPSHSSLALVEKTNGHPGVYARHGARLSQAVGRGQAGGHGLNALNGPGGFLLSAEVLRPSPGAQDWRNLLCSAIGLA